MMDSADQADATVRALDLLDPEDLANSDPRIFRDPQLARETQQTRQAAAEVWLAVSPLRVAPAEVFHELMAKIEPSLLAKPRGGRKVLGWLAASGWAAAMALAIFLWPRASTPQVQVSANPRTTADTALDATASVPLPRSPTPRASHLRKDIIRLQERLANVQQERSSKNSRVTHLTSPGRVRRTAEESQKRVQSILTEALRSALEFDSTSPPDPAELVIERGWLPGGLPLAADGAIIRHRNFPEQAWQEMGLLRSKQGEYLDATAQTLWSAAPDGRGFIGRKITVAEDLSRFKTSPDPGGAQTAQPKSAPEGFIIESGDDNKVEVVIDQVPALEAGSQHLIIITDSSGHTRTLPVPPPNPLPLLPIEKPVTDHVESAVGQAVALENSPDGYLLSTAVSAPDMLVFSITGDTNFTSFQLIEHSQVSDGQPDRIIVEGGP